MEWEKVMNKHICCLEDVQQYVVWDKSAMEFARFDTEKEAEEALSKYCEKLMESLEEEDE